MSDDELRTLIADVRDSRKKSKKAIKQTSSVKNPKEDRGKTNLDNMMASMSDEEKAALLKTLKGLD